MKIYIDIHIFIHLFTVWCAAIRSIFPLLFFFLLLCPLLHFILPLPPKFFLLSLLASLPYLQSYPILSSSILSCLIFVNPILPYLLQSYPTLSSSILSCLIFFNLILPYLLQSYPALSSSILSYLIFFNPILPYLLQSYPISFSHLVYLISIILAISHAMARDGSSGGVIRLVTIDKDGVEKEVILGKY